MGSIFAIFTIPLLPLLLLMNAPVALHLVSKDAYYDLIGGWIIENIIPLLQSFLGMQ